MKKGRGNQTTSDHSTLIMFFIAPAAAVCKALSCAVSYIRFLKNEQEESNHQYVASFKPSTKETYERNYMINPAWPRYHELGPALPRRTKDRYFRELDSATLAEGVMKICEINDEIIEKHHSYNDDHEDGYSSASEEVRGLECASKRLERAALFANEIGGKLMHFFFGWVYFYE